MKLKRFRRTFAKAFVERVCDTGEIWYEASVDVAKSKERSRSALVSWAFFCICQTLLLHLVDFHWILSDNIS